MLSVLLWPLSFLLAIFLLVLLCCPSLILSSRPSRVVFLCVPGASFFRLVCAGLAPRVLPILRSLHLAAPLPASCGSGFKQARPLACPGSPSVNLWCVAFFGRCLPFPFVIFLMMAFRVSLSSDFVVLALLLLCPGFLPFCFLAALGFRSRPCSFSGAVLWFFGCCWAFLCLFPVLLSAPSYGCGFCRSIPLVFGAGIWWLLALCC